MSDDKIYTPADLLAECERAAGIATASTEKEASK